MESSVFLEIAGNFKEGKENVWMHMQALETSTRRNSLILLTQYWPTTLVFWGST